MQFLKDRISKDPASDIVNLSNRERRLPFLIFYLNTHVVNLLYLSLRFKKAFLKADLVYADGWGGVIFLRLLGVKVKRRNTAPDFFDEFCRRAQSRGLSIFFLGSKDEVLEKLVVSIKKKFPNLKIAGFNNGYFKNEREIIEKINKSRADILLVGMGADRSFGLPRQETWSVKNRGKLKARAVWCVGGLFENLFQKRPEKGHWYFEWWQRIKENPFKMAPRYFIDGVVFLFVLIVVFLQSRLFYNRRRK